MSADLPTDGAAGMGMHTGLSLQDVLGAIRQHYRVGVLVAGSVVLGAVLFLLLSPKLYLSEARLFVRIGRESVSLDPTATTGERVTVYESRESELTSVIDLLKSRTLLEAVAEEIGLAVILDRPASGDEDRRKAIEVLSKAISTDHNSKSSVIGLACEFRSPELAQAILKSYLHAFRDLYVTAHRTSGSLEFFEKEATLAEAALLEAQQKLAAARRELAVGSFETRLLELQKRRGEIEDRLSVLRSELVLSRSRVAGVQRRVNELPERALSGDTGTNSAFDQTRGDLYRLQVKRDELLVRFTPQHPQVREIERQIAAAEDILLRHTTLPQFVSTGPVRQELELGVLRDETLVEALAAQQEELSEQLAATNAELVRLIDAQSQIEDLERQAEQRRKILVQTTDRLEEARIDRALAASKISNVNPIQPPTLDRKAVAPRKTLVLGLAGVAAIFAGLASTILMELLSSQFGLLRSAALQPDSQLLTNGP